MAPARALTVKVTPGGSAGQSLWSFSGSSTYTQLNPGGKFAGGVLSLIEEWKGDGGSDYVKTSTYNNYVAAIVSGSVSILVTPLVGSPSSGVIDGLHIDHDTSGDDFGVSLLGADIPLANGDVVSWSGSGIFPVDLANLNAGIFQFINYGGSADVPAAAPYGSIPLTLEVTKTPAPLPIIGCTAAFSFSRKLRKARRARTLTPAS